MGLHEEFLDEIDGALKGAGIPRAHFARWLGISPSTVTAVLSGAQPKVTFDRAERWAAVLGLRLRLVVERIEK